MSASGHINVGVTDGGCWGLGSDSHCGWLRAELDAVRGAAAPHSVHNLDKKPTRLIRIDLKDRAIRNIRFIAQI